MVEGDAWGREELQKVIDNSQLIADEELHWSLAGLVD